MLNAVVESLKFSCLHVPVWLEYIDENVVGAYSPLFSSLICLLYFVLLLTFLIIIHISLNS